MTTAKIFLVGKDEDDLTAMDECAYESEDVLQSALERYPDLLAGDQVNPDSPRRWLLVAREMGVPAESGEYDQWSLDHLFIDQDGYPTFVECKRATDTRARREVVAQMLDYAANGTVYWSADRLRQCAAETAKVRGRQLDDEVRRLTDNSEVDVEAFWARVDDNLKHGNVRLLFVADRIPRELQRLIEFLNEKMADVEVLGVEIKQFKAQAQRAMVPRVIGHVERTRAAKSSSQTPLPALNRQRLLEQVPPAIAKAYEYLLDVGVQRGHVIYWGTRSFSVRLKLPSVRNALTFAYAWMADSFCVYLKELPISAQEKSELRKQLLAFGIFKESGGHTLEARLDARALEVLPEVYGFLLDKMDEIARQY